MTGPEGATVLSVDDDSDVRGAYLDDFPARVDSDGDGDAAFVATLRAITTGGRRHDDG